MVGWKTGSVMLVGACARERTCTRARCVCARARMRVRGAGQSHTCHSHRARMAHHTSTILLSSLALHYPMSRKYFPLAHLLCPLLCTPLVRVGARARRVHPEAATVDLELVP